MYILLFIMMIFQSRSDGESDEGGEAGEGEERQAASLLDIDQCLELGQEAAHVGDVYEKVDF